MPISHSSHPARGDGRFTALLRSVSENIPNIEEPIPAVTRVPKDDYLLAYTVVGRADYLVSVDQDLLVLGRVGQVSICSPREFVTLLADIDR